MGAALQSARRLRDGQRLAERGVLLAPGAGERGAGCKAGDAGVDEGRARVSSLGYMACGIFSLLVQAVSAACVVRSGARTWARASVPYSSSFGSIDLVV